jgi:uncharacterized membrane protein YqiK
MKKIPIILGMLLVLLLLVLFVLFFMGKRTLFSKNRAQTIIVTPQKLSEINPITNFKPRKLIRDSSGRVLSIPENEDTVSPPEDRTFIY